MLGLKLDYQGINIYNFGKFNLLTQDEVDKLVTLDENLTVNDFELAGQLSLSADDYYFFRVESISKILGDLV